MFFRIFHKQKKSPMKKIFITAPLFDLIKSGIVNSVFIDESNDMLLNEPLLVSLKDRSDSRYYTGDLECSVNDIRTHKTENGLKKDYSIISISVVRIIPSDEFYDVTK